MHKRTSEVTLARVEGGLKEDIRGGLTLSATGMTHAMEPAWPDELFRNIPKKWGLRGDPGLWNELSEVLALEPRPASGDGFRALLVRTIEGLIGTELHGHTVQPVDRYDHGGISGGQVCGAWWMDKGVPLLLSRFNASE